MSKCVLVHGCGWTSHDVREMGASRQIMNRGLAQKNYPLLESADLKCAHIVHLLERRPGNKLPGENPVVRVMCQVHRFIKDSALRAETIDSVASAIDDDTEVVIAHSLGSVVAYEALCLLPRHNVKTLVTLASPLAIPHYVMGQLAAFSAFGRFAWPRTVRHWLNFYDYRDPIAFRHLRKYFGDGNRIEERSIRIPSNSPHRLNGYLGCLDIISSVGEALTGYESSPDTSGRQAER